MDGKAPVVRKLNQSSISTNQARTPNSSSNCLSTVNSRQTYQTPNKLEEYPKMKSNRFCQNWIKTWSKSLWRQSLIKDQVLNGTISKGYQMLRRLYLRISSTLNWDQTCSQGLELPIRVFYSMDHQEMVKQCWPRLLQQNVIPPSLASVLVLWSQNGWERVRNWCALYLQSQPHTHQVSSFSMKSTQCSLRGTAKRTKLPEDWKLNSWFRSMVLALLLLGSWSLLPLIGPLILMRLPLGD